MSREIEFVDPADIFTNWPDLALAQKKALEEAQYKNQMYSKTYGD